MRAQVTAGHRAGEIANIHLGHQQASRLFQAVRRVPAGNRWSSRMGLSERRVFPSYPLQGKMYTALPAAEKGLPQPALSLWSLPKEEKIKQGSQLLRRVD